MGTRATTLACCAAFGLLAVLAPARSRRGIGPRAPAAAPGGAVIGLDGVDPLLWWDSDFLLSEERCAEALEALDAFASATGGGGIEDPLRRAILQHDLWTFFDWAVAASPQGAIRGERRRALARALGRALERVALGRDQIAGLPDNYRAAVAAGASFLPTGLEDPGGPWVLLGDADAAPTPLAVQHAEVFGGRSSFAVLLRLPGGREDTLGYLTRLRSHPAPTLPCRSEDCFQSEVPGEPHAHLSPRVPSPPPGSAVALVRRLVLFDDQGELHPTPLVRSIQLRTFLESPPRAAPVTPGKPRPEGWPWQAMAEIVLDRARLFAGDARGLVPIGPAEHAFAILGSHGDGVDLLPADFDPDEPPGAHLASCVACHGTPGIHSMNSYTGFATGPGTHYWVPVLAGPRRLAPQGPEAFLVRALGFKRRRYDWGVLQGLGWSND